MLEYHINENVLRGLMEQKCFTIHTPECFECLKCCIIDKNDKIYVPSVSLNKVNDKYIVEYKNYKENQRNEFDKFFKGEINLFEKLKELPTIEDFLREHCKNQNQIVKIWYKNRIVYIKVEFLYLV